MSKNTQATYTHIGEGEVLRAVVTAINALEGEAQEQARTSYQYEQHDDFAGTWFVSFYVSEKRHADDIGKALAAAGGDALKIEANTLFDDDLTDENGLHLIEFFVTASDFDGSKV